MNIELSKLELIEMLLHTQSEAVLNKVKAVLQEEPENTSEDFRNEAFYNMLDERREEYLSGKGKSYTWEEIKANARKASKDV